MTKRLPRKAPVSAVERLHPAPPHSRERRFCLAREPQSPTWGGCAGTTERRKPWEVCVTLCIAAECRTGEKEKDSQVVISLDRRIETGIAAGDAEMKLERLSSRWFSLIAGT